MNDTIVCRVDEARGRRTCRRVGLRHLRRAECDECGAAILCTRSSLRAQVEGEATLLCTQCAARGIASGELPAALVATAEAARVLDSRRRELAAELGVDVARVCAWPPASLRAALDAVRRQN